MFFPLILTVNQAVTVLFNLVFCFGRSGMVDLPSYVQCQNNNKKASGGFML